MAVAATVHAWLARSGASTPQVILIATGRKPGVGDTATIVSEDVRLSLAMLTAQPSPRMPLVDATLATFYESLLSMRRVQGEPGWVVIGDAPDRPGVAFARIPDYRPPTWPDGERLQYRHFDV